MYSYFILLITTHTLKRASTCLLARQRVYASPQSYTQQQSEKVNPTWMSSASCFCMALCFTSTVQNVGDSLRRSNRSGLFASSRALHFSSDVSAAAI